MSIASLLLALVVYLPIVTSTSTYHEIMSPAPPTVPGTVVASTFNYWLGCLADGDEQGDYLTDIPAEYQDQATKVCRQYAEQHEGDQTYTIDLYFAGRYWPSMTGSQYTYLMQQNQAYMTGDIVDWGTIPNRILANNIILWKLVDLYTSHE